MAYKKCVFKKISPFQKSFFTKTCLFLILISIVYCHGVSFKSISCFRICGYFPLGSIKEMAISWSPFLKLIFQSVDEVEICCIYPLKVFGCKTWCPISVWPFFLLVSKQRFDFGCMFLDLLTFSHQFHCLKE